MGKVEEMIDIRLGSDYQTFDEIAHNQKLVEKNIRLKCVDLATRTSQIEGSGSIMPHDVTSLVKAAELIYTFINK